MARSLVSLCRVAWAAERAFPTPVAPPLEAEGSGGGGTVCTVPGRLPWFRALRVLRPVVVSHRSYENTRSTLGCRWPKKGCPVCGVKKRTSAALSLEGIPGAAAAPSLSVDGRLLGLSGDDGE